MMENVKPGPNIFLQNVQKSRGGIPPWNELKSKSVDSADRV